MADPISLGSCALWLDATIGVTDAGGGAVSNWADQSGNGRDATATTTARPTTGTRTFPVSLKNVLDFDGSLNRMTTSSFGLTQSFTVAAVVLNDSGANSTQQLVISDVTNTRSMLKLSTNTFALFDGNSLVGPAADTSAHYFIGLAKASPNAVISVDGAETSGNAGNGSWAGGVAIGGKSSDGSSAWNGMIAEVVVYTIELTAGNRTSLGTYFTNKWFTAPSTVDQNSELPGQFNNRDL